MKEKGILSKKLKSKLEEVCFRNLTDGGKAAIMEFIKAGKTPHEIEVLTKEKLSQMGINGAQNTRTASQFFLAAKYAQTLCNPRPASTSDSKNDRPHAA